MINNVNFSNLFIVLRDVPGHQGEYASLEQALKAGAITLNFGNFLNSIISFLIVAFAVFLVIKTINKIETTFAEDKSVAPTTKKCPYCCSSISIKAVRCPECTSCVESDEKLTSN